MQIKHKEIQENSKLPNIIQHKAVYKYNKTAKCKGDCKEHTKNNTHKETQSKRYKDQGTAFFLHIVCFHVSLEDG